MPEMEKKPEFSFGRSLLFTLIIFVVFLLLLEGGVRGYYLLTNTIVRDKTHAEALSSVAGSINGAMSNQTHSAKAAR